jgi:hypothetical protein
MVQRSAGRLTRPVIALHDTIVEVKFPGSITRFRLDMAEVTLLSSGRRPIHWRFMGSKGSVILELPRKAAWGLIENLHEQSIAPGPVAASGQHKYKINKP